MIVTQKYKKLSLLIMMALVSASLFSQQTLSLSQAIEKGLTNNFDVQIQKLDVEAAEINNDWGAAGALPSVALSGVGQYKKNDVQGKTGFISPSLSFNWLLFNGFSVRMRKTKLNYLEQLTKGNLQLIIENNLQAIILAYYKASIQQQRLVLLKDIMSLSESRYNRTQSGVEIGAESTYELLQAKTAWLSDKSNYLTQEVQLQAAVRQLYYLLGEPIAVAVQLTDSIESPNQEYALSDLIIKMESNNTNIKQQFLNLSMLDNEVALAKSGYYPSVSFGAGADQTGYVESMTDYSASGAPFDNYNYYARFSLNWNLFDGHKVKRNIQLSEIEKSIGNINLENVKLQLKNRLMTLWEQYNVRRELVEIANLNIEAAKLNLELSEEKYKKGVINSFNFRDVQNNYLNIGLQQLNAIYDLIDTHTDLVRLTGGIVSEYQP